jgi:tyrosyl-tRNA synthetase
MNKKFKSAKEQYEIIREKTAEIIGPDELRSKLEASHVKARPLRVKWGADPSAPDIHLGHAVVLRKLRQFQDLGHKVQFLIGDFTAMIGDPTGKSATRKPLTQKEIEINAKTYLEQVFKILDPDPDKIEIRRNSEWCRPMSFEDVIRLSSKYTVARILERDDFTNRMKEQKPISLHELLYPLIQGYDSVKLESDIEMCGTDQKFNCIVGRALQMDAGLDPEVIVAMPILEGLDGVKKMSKSLNNYVGITDRPNEMFGKIMSISDELMWKYFDLLTNFEVDQLINKYSAGNQTNLRDCKMYLAYEITRWLCGENDAIKAEKFFKSRKDIFETVNYDDSIVEEKDETFSLKEVSLEKGKYLAADLLVRLQIAKSKSIAKELIRNSAFELRNINDNKIELIKFFNQEIPLNNPMLIRCGKVIIKVKPL